MNASAAQRRASRRTKEGGRLKVTFAGVSDEFPTGSRKISSKDLVLAYDMRTLTHQGALKDFSGKGNDGRVVGTDVVQGPFGPARAFLRASDYVGLPGRRSLHARGPVSIAAWVKFNRLGQHQHIVSYDDLYTLWIDERDRFRFADTRGNAFESTRGIVPTGEWCAIVASFAGRPGTPVNVRNITLCVNGQSVAGRAFGVWNPGRPVEGYVGKESHYGQFYLPLLGEVAAVLIFRRPLSVPEAQAFSDVPFAARTPGPSAEELQRRARPESALPGGGLPWSWQGAQEDGSPSHVHGETPQVHVPDSSLTNRIPPNLEIRRGGTRVSKPAPGLGTWRPPRVVRITNLLPPYRLPSLEILQNSPRVQFETWLMAASERNRRWALPSNPNVQIFRDWGLDLTHRDMFTAHFNPGMIRQLSDRPPDLVILGGYDQPTCLSVGLLLDRMGIPFLLSSENISLRDSFVGRWASFLVRKLVRRSAGVIVPGQASREHLLDLGAPADRIFVAPNTVDIDRFAPASSAKEKRAVREALGLPETTLCLYVGRLSQDKGLPDLLDAFHSLQPRDSRLHLLIVGDGRLRETVESRVAGDPSLRESVSMVGYAPEDLLPKYYMASDIFVFPTRRDIWGLVLNEAMSAGLPVVSSDGAAAARDLIEEGVSGITVPHGNAHAIEAAIARLHQDGELRRRMGLEARRRVLSGFTPRHQASAVLHAITTTLVRLGRLSRDPRGRE